MFEYNNKILSKKAASLIVPGNIIQLKQYKLILKRKQPNYKFPPIIFQQQIGRKTIRFLSPKSGTIFLVIDYDFPLFPKPILVVKLLWEEKIIEMSVNTQNYSIEEFFSTINT